MKQILAATLLLGSICIPSFAAQDDPRLPPLFEALKVAPNDLAASQIQAQIWQIWLEAPNQDAQDLLERGVDAMRLGDLATAFDLFDQLVKASPNYAEGWNKRATVNYMVNALDASLSDIDETLKLEPNHFGALFGRGMVLVKKGDLNAAIDAFREAQLVIPGSTRTEATIQSLMNQLGQEQL